MPAMQEAIEGCDYGFFFLMNKINIRHGNGKMIKQGGGRERKELLEAGRVHHSCVSRA